MRRLTIRAWLLVISVLFSVLAVGGISLVSYAIVYEGMVTVAKEHSKQVVGDISASLNRNCTNPHPRYMGICRTASVSTA